MKRFNFTLWTIGLILLTLSVISAQTDTLTIVYVNDTHGCLSPTAPRDGDLNGTRGGIARAASVIGLSKMTDPNPLFLHGGDFSIGDLLYNMYFGVPELQIIKSLGCDALVLGNHEFDLTPYTLMTALEAGFVDGAFPVISSNMILGSEDVAHLADLTDPFTIKETGNLKVGIFGLTTPETNLFSLPAPVFIDTLVAETAYAMVQTLISEGCNFIICLSHMGLYYDQQIASAVPGMNLIISAHDHYIIETPVEVTDPLGGITYIVQAGAFYENVGKCQFAIENGSINLLGNTIIPLDETIPEEPTVAGLVDGLIFGFELINGKLFTQQIGTATEDFAEVADLQSPGSMDTPVGNLVTDAFRNFTGTDIAIQVGGSTAQPLYQGPIVTNDVFRMLGYGFNEVNGLGFRIVTFDISGELLWFAIESVLATIELNDELLPQVSGMNYFFDPAKPVGSRLQGILVNGSPLDPSAFYSVTANEFLLAAFQDFLGITIDPASIQLYEDVAEVQVVANYISSLGTISPQSGDRILTDLEHEGEIAPLKFALEQNYPNPFNPATSIQFSLSSNADVSLKIYNMLGEEISVLVDQELKAGIYTFNWDAKGLSSGIYFYKLDAGEFSQTRKMMLLK